MRTKITLALLAALTIAGCGGQPARIPPLPDGDHYVILEARGSIDESDINDTCGYPDAVLQVTNLYGPAVGSGDSVDDLAIVTCKEEDDR